MKTNQRLLLLLGLALLTTPLAAMQQPVPAAAPVKVDELPDARAVIERFATVTKLQEKLAATRSRHETGTARIGTSSGTTESWSLAPDRNLHVLSIPGFGEMRSGCDGENAWLVSPTQGTFLYEGADLMRARLESAYLGALKPAEHYESMRTVGTKTFEGKECVQIELVARPLPGMDPEKTRAARTVQEYYDVASGLLIGSEGTMEGALVSGPFTNVHSDYKDFGGVVLASRSRVRQGAVEVLLTLESVEFDTVTEEQVQPPPVVRALLQARIAPARPQ
jgi:hypothetical protein